MTLVGDIAQTGALGGARSWHEVLHPYVADRWKLAELTVNYRTPAEIMTLAARILSEMDTDLAAPASVRSSGHSPFAREIPNGELATKLPEVVAAELRAVDVGTLAVLLPSRRFDELGSQVAAAVPGAVVGTRPEGLESPAVLLTVDQAKGLEFDSVLVVEPAEILAESARGLNDLYVALTRTTQRLGIVHAGELPEVLSDLA